MQFNQTLIETYQPEFKLPNVITLPAQASQSDRTPALIPQDAMITLVNLSNPKQYFLRYGNI